MDAHADLVQAITARQADRDLVADYFRARPLQPVTREELERVVRGDVAAIRTRVSNCRKDLGMQIDSFPTVYLDPNGKERKGKHYYVFIPYVPLGRAAHEYREQASLF